jgi:hypothetical protein
MPRPGHFGDCAGVWNKLVKELWLLVGEQVLADHLKSGPNSALMAIRRIRKSRNAKQGNSEIKLEAKILICFRDGIPWSTAFVRDIDYIVNWKDGGKEELSNIRLVA